MKKARGGIGEVICFGSGERGVVVVAAADSEEGYRWEMHQLFILEQTPSLLKDTTPRVYPPQRSLADPLESNDELSQRNDTLL